MQGPADQKLQTLTTIVYWVAKERLEEAKARNKLPTPSRGQTRIDKLRRELSVKATIQRVHRRNVAAYLN
ncbi:hypothetical protein DPMN_083229 [Dreissena polymorpha]|uniref:Uncharacterized protein n=1 Tax=Dreissena polymorpha TaxID=45954 RepID=A0A9D4BHI1_DREPO|nr:hypothetical protein DPMN_083229 [Dreissena polymorpha]